jgi:methionyl aminopeptidase
MARRWRSALRISLKRPDELEKMRRAGRVVALALSKVGQAIAAGITTGELDTVAAQTIRAMGARPAFLGYRGYPATACISVNDEVVHGIPGPRQLKDGDVVGVDLGAIVEGWYADAALTFAVGTPSAEAARLMETGQQALAAGIAQARSGGKLGDISAAVQREVEGQGFSVVRDLCGHGIGRRMHEDPQIPNYVTDGGHLRLEAGMALAIEPMLNAGAYPVKIMADGWTYCTMDGSLSVHYEHTVIVGDDGPEIITVLR